MNPLVKSAHQLYKISVTRHRAQGRSEERHAIRGAKLRASVQRQWNHDWASFPKGPNFPSVQIGQILYGFYTSRWHERDGGVSFEKNGLDFSAIFCHGMMVSDFSTWTVDFVLFDATFLMVHSDLTIEQPILQPTSNLSYMKFFSHVLPSLLS